MSNRTHALAQQLTGKASVEECSLEEVQQLCKRYPFYAPAQFLLAQKLKQIESPDLVNQQKKAVLFFPDPLLFDYFISSDKFYSDEVFSGNEIAASPNIDQHRNTIVDTTEDTKDVVPDVTSFGTENTTVSEEIAVFENENENPPFLDLELDKIQNSSDEKPYGTNSQELETRYDDVNDLQNTTTELSVIDNSVPAIEIETNNTANTKEADQTQSQKEELAFEPYHTVDYFASQGIKVLQDGLSNDRLGKQLKSFTDWLKTMKRLPPSHIVERVEIIAEQKVEKLASHSVTESTVITEAMAEVWAKQGNKEKATETYNKLSLLNPSKKAFFAAKIENLKTS